MTALLIVAAVFTPSLLLVVACAWRVHGRDLLNACRRITHDQPRKENPRA